MWIIKMNMPLVLMSLVGGGMIVIVALLKKIFGRFLPKRLFPLLWICVLIRLLLPFSLSTPFNLTSLPDWKLPVFFERFAESADVIVQAGTAGQTAETNVTEDRQIAYTTTNEVTQSALPIFQWNWSTIRMAGTLLLGGFLFWRYTQTRRKFDDSILIEDDARVNSILEERNVRAEVYLNDQIQGPLVSGVLRPLIFLPASLDFRDPELLRNILLHECAHIRRRDNLMKLVALLALCIHWFNPLVWLMINWISRDLEEACDETVLTILDVQQRQSYARALIQMSRKRLKFAWNYCAFSRNEVERRVRSIAAYKPLKKIMTAGCLGLLVCFSMITAAAAQTPFSSELSSMCSSADSRFMLEAELTRDLNLPLTQEIRSRADQALIHVLRENPQDGLNALREEAATALAAEFHAEPRAFHIDVYLNLSEEKLDQEYREHELIYDHERYTYQGKKVRVMEDKMAGRYSTQSDGQVDVYIERDDRGEIVEVKTYLVKD